MQFRVILHCWQALGSDERISVIDKLGQRHDGHAGKSNQTIFSLEVRRDINPQVGTKFTAPTIHLDPHGQPFLRLERWSPKIGLLDGWDVAIDPSARVMALLEGRRFTALEVELNYTASGLAVGAWVDAEIKRPAAVLGQRT